MALFVPSAIRYLRQRAMILEKKKDYLFHTEFIVFVAVLSLQMFQFKVGKIIFMLDLSHDVWLTFTCLLELT